MRRHHGLSKAGLVLALAALVAAGVATVSSARPDTVETTAKLGPVPARAGNDALYRTSFTNSQGTMNKVTSTTTLPAGVSVVATTPAAPGCTVNGLVVTCSFGSARNSSHDHDTGLSTRPVMEKVHSSSGVYGVGPAERTGKSSTRYWPGGMRVGSTSLRRRPKKPREIGDDIPSRYALR